MSVLAWEREGRDWPHRDASRFVDAAGLRWQVQVMGEGPVLLLLHGTGASTHSWRDMMTPLSRHFTVVAPDLPGHAFTRGRIAGGPTLPRIADALRDLLGKLGANPAMIAGHSAGAAIALELAAESTVPVAGFGVALMPFTGAGAQLFPAMAKLLFVNPFVPSIFAHLARKTGEIERFVGRATNSRIDSRGLGCYATLIGNSEHCAGALAMMANWDLHALRGRLPTMRSPVLLAHGTRDNAVPISSAQEACALLPDCDLVRLDGLGHLAHEERPQRAVDLILRHAGAQGIVPAERMEDD
ncbi:alpha/beta fold hydrolase BchO [Croceicoccus sp. BE223]|uniref:alpha/beta fold hydrolase BchO n=1 Tax=Croceicoccus sp. BE223 TaxID=2817716 RepID=UPI0028567582|nr:alpha/beta fold hydrolase BchO [Croceicoccus sp. BE223]MDR7101590.1 magnesium chelatase accessory protein [Croceicoccus sp. BE223]